MRRSYIKAFILILGIFTAAAPAVASQEGYRLVIRDHRFEPKELSVPAGQKLKLSVDNQDATPEEFESFELNREKVVMGNSTISVILGPLKPGRYKFFGDFHKDTAQGVIVAGGS